MITRTLPALCLVLGLWVTPGDIGAQVIADSFDDWSATGTQGEKGWSPTSRRRNRR